jgi:hypothetical protein
MGEAIYNGYICSSGKRNCAVNISIKNKKAKDNLTKIIELWYDDSADFLTFRKEAIMAFTITVWRGNKPAKNTRVGVSFSGFSRGSTESYTDNEGRAFFESDTGKGTVYIDGKDRYTGILSGEVKITL